METSSAKPRHSKASIYGRAVILIRLIIVDEIEYLRLGLKTAFDDVRDIEVVGDFGETGDVMDAVERLSPDVVLMSMNRQEDYSLSTCRKIVGLSPSVKVLLMDYPVRPEQMVASTIVGASGYVETGTPKEELFHAIRAVANGGSYFDRSMTDMVLRKLQELMKGKAAWISDVLSERDTTILSMIASGATNEQIGLRLNIATATVRNNITAIRSKLGLSPRTNRAQLVSYAYRHGLVDDSQVDSSSSSMPN